MRVIKTVELTEDQYVRLWKTSRGGQKMAATILAELMSLLSEELARKDLAFWEAVHRLAGVEASPDIEASVDWVSRCILIKARDDLKDDISVE